VVGRKYNRDIRNALEWNNDNNTQEWTFTVETSDTAEVTLSWYDIENSVPVEFEDQPYAEYRFTLEDLSSGEQVDMWDTDEYTYLSSGSRNFHVYVEALEIGSNKQVDLPTEFNISGIYPNPFNSTTTIRYSLPIPTHVSLEVYNLTGQQITTMFEGYLQAGFHSTNLIANNLPSGLYFVRLKASEQVVTQKVMLIR